MVAHLLRLKLTLLRNGLRRSPWQVVGLVLAAAQGLALLVLALGGLVALRFVPAGEAAVVATLAGSALVLGWWCVPLVTAGVDATLDPQRFVTFAVPHGRLLAGLALGGLVGVPGAVTAVLGLGTVVSWSRGPLTVVAALVGATLGVATCVVGARAWTTALARLVGSRRFREGATLLVLVPLVLLGPLLSALAAVLASGAGALPELAQRLSWTPLGAAWALPGAVATGDWLGAAVRLAVAAGTVAGLTALWSHALARALVQPPAPGRRDGRGRGPGLLGRVPATPTWAVAARCLVYWVRDPRYSGSLVMVPLLPVLLHLAAPDGLREPMLIAAPAAAMLIGWAISADVAFDSTAFALHVSAGISGTADRAGRVLAAAVIGVPVTVALGMGSVWWVGRWSDAPAVLGVSLGMLLSALGLASVVSARFVYPVPLPGQSPFSTPAGSVGVNLLTQLLGFSTLLVLVLPELVLGGVAIARGSLPLGMATLAVGLLVGGGVLAGGLRLGARVYERRAPELLQEVAGTARTPA